MRNVCRSAAVKAVACLPHAHRCHVGNSTCEILVHVFYFQQEALPWAWLKHTEVLASLANSWIGFSRLRQWCAMC